MVKNIDMETYVSNVEAFEYLVGKDKGEGLQEKLLESDIVLIGSDILAQMIIANLIGLGVGKIHLIDNRRIGKNETNFMCKRGVEENIGKEKVHLIGEQVRRDYKNIDIKTKHSAFNKSFMPNTGRPQIIIDATNNPHSKIKCYKYSARLGIPLFSASSSFYDGIFSFYNPIKGKRERDSEEEIRAFISNIEYNNINQGFFSSGIIAGLVGEQILRILTSYDWDNLVKGSGRLYYNLLSNTRNGTIKVNNFTTPDLSNLKALVVGGGGVGNFVVLNLTLLGFGSIDIIDGDRVERGNNNRQTLNAMNVDEYKAKSLEWRIKEINPGIDAEGIPKYLEDNDQDLFNSKNGSPKYDIIFGCVDNFKTRLYINKLAVEYKTIYIDGGVTLDRGGLSIYIPGISKCIDCQKTLIKLKDEKKSGESAYKVNPSVVPPHIIIGSAMVGEAFRILYNKNYQRGEFIYDTNYKEKISFEEIGGLKAKMIEMRAKEHGC